MSCDNADNLDLDCGIAYARIAAWLDDELNLPRESAQKGQSLLGGFTWELETADGVCHIQLEVLEPRWLGNVELERTRLLASGTPAALKRFNDLFTLRFMSAGG